MSVTLREKASKKGGRVSLYLDITHNGRRYKQYLGISVNKKKPTPEDKEKRAKAEEIRISTEHELIVKDNGLIDKKKKLGSFIAYYEKFLKTKKTRNHYSATLSHMKAYVGNKPFAIAHVTTKWMKDFEAYLLKRVPNNNTVLHYLKTINCALNKLKADEVIKANPWHAVPEHERLKKKAVKHHTFTVEQLELLAATPCDIHPQIKQASFFAAFTGLRWSDTNPLQWSEIIVKNVQGRERWFIYFEQEKTENVEYLPLSEQAVEILKERKRERKENNEAGAYVFPVIKERDEKNKLQYNVVRAALKKWGRAAIALHPEAGFTLEMFKFHNFRHFFATVTLENGADLFTVGKLLGHRSWYSTQIYAHVHDKLKAQAVDALPTIKMQIVHSPKQKAA